MDAKSELLEHVGKFAPAIYTFFTLLFSAAFFNFVLKVAKMTERGREKKARASRLYEVAYRRADGESRRIAQLAIAVAAAHNATPRSQATVNAYLGILSEALGDRDENGVWKPDAHQDFLLGARAELELIEVDEDEQTDSGGEDK